MYDDYNYFSYKEYFYKSDGNQPFGSGEDLISVSGELFL